MPFGWEGNRRSGVALAMRHRPQWFIHLWVQGIWKEGEPTLPMEHGTLNIYLSDGRYLSDVPRACSAV